MNSVIIKRKEFLKLYGYIVGIFEGFDGLFQYYLRKNVMIMNDEYICLSSLVKDLEPNHVIMDFKRKQTELVNNLLLNGVNTDFHLQKSHEILVSEYLDDINWFDTKTNNISSFLKEEMEINFIPIPHRYFPEKLDPFTFSLLYKFIEEDKVTLLNKFGVDND